MEKIYQGAEAILYRDDGQLIKDRIAKGYRLPIIDDKLRRLRTRGEAKILDAAARAGINVPRVLGAETNVLKMEFIDGKRLKDALNLMDEKERDKACVLIGEAAARLHSAGIVHGDMTTSNMILKDESLGSFGGCERKAKLFLIDFGLGKISSKVEDQAVDLYLLYEALKAAHFEYLNRSWQYILKSYIDNYKSANAVIERFKIIEKRRRYKGD